MPKTNRPPLTKSSEAASLASSSGLYSGTRQTPILNPFVALAYAAAVTKRIRLATGRSVGTGGAVVSRA
jgi:alkanesulfonate monooxygenase SsuD/methylene tetrahydromethanopterin reductase-like flavin-dependent oxidoreductase (luciferase family)